MKNYFKIYTLFVISLLVISSCGNKQENIKPEITRNQQDKNVMPGEDRSSQREPNARDESSGDRLYPEASERYLEPQDVENLSLWELKIMRNEIFASYGYIFKTDDMRSYFSSQSWYSPGYDDVNSMLSKIERDNIEFIKRYEERLGNKDFSR